jgi:hypothetical protein
VVTAHTDPVCIRGVTIKQLWKARPRPRGISHHSLWRLMPRLTCSVHIIGTGGSISINPRPCSIPALSLWREGSGLRTGSLTGDSVSLMNTRAEVVQSTCPLVVFCVVEGRATALDPGFWSGARVCDQPPQGSGLSRQEHQLSAGPHGLQTVNTLYKR